MNEKKKFVISYTIDLISFFVLLAPYICIKIGFFGDGAFFYLFSYGLIALLPVGGFMLLIQPAIRKFRGFANEFILGCSWITIVVGTLGLMLIFAVTSK